MSRGRCSRLCALGGLALLGCIPASAQEVMGNSAEEGAVHLVQTDWATLELREPRKDLPCTVTPAKATLGFDLRMHAGYSVSLPLKELAGSEDLLTIIFRVTPASRKDEPVFFTQRIPVPFIEEDAKGETFLEGSFDLGEGKYTLDWLMRDRTERVCSAYWDVEAALSDRDKDVDMALGPGRVAASSNEPFQEEPPVARSQGDPPLNVKVLVNFAPPNVNSAVLQPLDRNALLSILRSISREPKVGKFSIVAFNLQEQRVIFRQDDASRIDFRALGEALDSLNLGTTDLRRLSQKNGEAQFLTSLVRRETEGESRPDALIFAGPKALLDQNVSSEDLRKIGPFVYPMFYMNYNLHPEVSPWRDAIGSIVKFFRGTEFTITRPRDMWMAVGEMISRISQSRTDRAARRAAVR